MLYRARAPIEQTVGKLKRFKRVALRCEKTVGDRKEADPICRRRDDLARPAG